MKNIRTPSTKREIVIFIYFENGSIFLVIRKEIILGNISTAKKFINEIFPIFFENNREIFILLNCQEFIEIYRSKNVFEAINYAKENLWNLIEEKIQVEKDGKIENITIQNIVGLICYPDIEKSNLNFLMSEKQKEFVADEVNIKLLSKKLLIINYQFFFI
jgi:hypothetical protein